MRVACPEGPHEPSMLPTGWLGAVLGSGEAQNIQVFVGDSSGERLEDHTRCRPWRLFSTRQRNLGWGCGGMGWVQNGPRVLRKNRERLERSGAPGKLLQDSRPD